MLKKNATNFGANWGNDMNEDLIRIALEVGGVAAADAVRDYLEKMRAEDCLALTSDYLKIAALAGYVCGVLGSILERAEATMHPEHYELMDAGMSAVAAQFGALGKAATSFHSDGVVH